MTHKKPYLSSILLVLGVFGCINLYSCFAPQTNTPCKPLGFPDGERIDAESRKIYTFVTDETLQDVADYYRINLQFDPPLKDMNGLIKWKEYPIRDVGILFECGSSGRLLSELGCIFVHNKDEKVVIEIMWSQNEGPGLPCYFLPDIEPEDY